MRHWLAIAVVACFVALNAAACSSAPTENSATASQDLLLRGPICPPGFVTRCNVDGCRCVCGSTNIVYPPVPASDTGPGTTGVFVQAWAVSTRNGQCPAISTPTGTWQQYGTVARPASLTGVFDGVPTEWGFHARPGCQQALDRDICCTYVWVPAGWPTSSPPPQQDTDGLCSANNIEAAAIWSAYCNENFSTCGEPGAGGCGACQKIGP
jgi:hypothetical protein